MGSGVGVHREPGGVVLWVAGRADVDACTDIPSRIQGSISIALTDDEAQDLISELQTRLSSSPTGSA